MNDELLLGVICASRDRWWHLAARLSLPAYDARWPTKAQTRSTSETQMTQKGTSACLANGAQTDRPECRASLLCESSVPRMARTATTSTATLI
jgi:hypothetical protein